MDFIQQDMSSDLLTASWFIACLMCLLFFDKFYVDVCTRKNLSLSYEMESILFFNICWYIITLIMLN